MIQALDAPKITAIAHRLTAQLLFLLEIDIRKDVPLDRTWTDTEGTRRPVFGDLYDPNSPLFRALLPQIERAIREAVATSHNAELDVNIVLSDPEHRGLLDWIDQPELKAQLQAALQQLKNSHKLKELNLRMELKLDLEDSKEKRGLALAQMIYMNETQVVRALDTLREMEHYAAHTALRYIPKF